MRSIRCLFVILIGALGLPGWSLSQIDAAQGQAARSLRIIAFGAHPDDAELKFGGTATLFAAQGHKVKLVALTNGDVGHFSQAGGPLAQRRKAEVEACHARLGVATDVLDIHDGELMPDLETRKKVANLIRDWQADIVLLAPPVDYHPYHRAVGEACRRRSPSVARRRILLHTPAHEGQSLLFYSDNSRSRTRSIRHRGRL